MLIIFISNVIHIEYVGKTNQSFHTENSLCV